MPGIVGLVSRMPRERALSVVQRMTSAMHHESFYETGSWHDESQGVYVGWATRRDSQCPSRNPLVNGRGDITLVFSGEEFSESGTTALASRSEVDSTFPASLNGRFQGVLVDRTRKTATLFNDRWGMHRIYYHEGEDGFYFAAEAKAILAVRPELRRLHPPSLGEFISCGCVLENRTLFDGIHALPPASAWRFENACLRTKGAYFSPEEWERQETLDPEAYYQELKQVFSRTLPEYFTAPSPIGVSLTGGLDTRMIMAWHKAAAGSLPSYSFGSMFRDNQDVAVARQVARVCGQPYQVIPVDRAFLAEFPRYAERTVYLTDGCNEVNRAADLFVNQKAREISPIRMTGNYGGEVLRRVRAFKPVDPPHGLFQPELLQSVEQARTTYRGIIGGHPLSFAVFRQAPWHHYSLLALEESQLSLRTPYLDNDFVRTVFRAPASATLDDGVCLRLIGDGDARLRQMRTDRGVGPADSLLTRASRNLLEFTFKAEYAYDYGMPQAVARIDHAVSWLHPERLFLGRHKFAHYRVWYRDELASYVRDMLLNPLALSRPYVERRRVEHVVHGHLDGGRNYTTAIHKLLTLELLHRLFVDAPVSPAMVN